MINFASAQTASHNISPAVDMNPLSAIFSASLVVQLTLMVLVGLSILCWALAVTKWRQFKVIKKSNDPFLTRFLKTTSLDSLNEDFDSYRSSPLARIFKAGYLEMQKLASQQNQNNQPMSSLTGIDNVERALKKSSDLEIAAMESHLTLLATTGSTGPFIGLFGTVWGIMASFHKIGQTGSASLAVVAPGISEALIATAVGLGAAIPAVILYNYFINETKRQEIELNNFNNDFINIIKRHFFKQ